MTELQTSSATSAWGDPAPRSGRARRRGAGGSRIRALVKHVLLIAFTLVVLYPVLWLVVSSFRPNDEIFRTPGLWLTDIRFENYVEGWDALRHPFSRYLLNSLLVVAGSVIGNLVSCSLAAYAFARLNFRFKKTAFALMLLGIMLPLHVVIIPQYLLFSNLGWLNTFAPLIVPKLLATDSFFIFLMVQFLRGLPRELDEAARIDGAGHLRTFWQILLPLMMPALATTAIFTFIWTWNDFFTQLIFLTRPDMYTVPVALRAFVDSTGSTSWGALFAMSVVSLIPLFLVFLFGQRFLVKGIATSGIK
jgi:multiple sugar transport system permease protein